MCNSVVMKLSKQREEQDLQHFQWRMPVFGTTGDLNSLRTVANMRSRFAEQVIKASKGEKGIIEPTFVDLAGVPGGDVIAKETGVDFFSIPIELGVCPQHVPESQEMLTRAQVSGAENARNILEHLSEDEKNLLEPAKTGLKGNIAKGIDFIHNPPPK